MGSSGYGRGEERVGGRWRARVQPIGSAVGMGKRAGRFLPAERTFLGLVDCLSGSVVGQSKVSYCNSLSHLLEFSIFGGIQKSNPIMIIIFRVLLMFW
jgi:hypothetical protein